MAVILQDNNKLIFSLKHNNILLFNFCENLGNNNQGFNRILILV